MSSTDVPFAVPPGAWTPDADAPTFRFDHRLHVDEPLFRLESLAELCDRLRPDQLELTSPYAPAVVEHRLTQHLGQAPEGARASDIVRSVEHEPRWMALRNIETDPLYGELVESLFERFLATSGIDRTSVYRPEGYVFISSKGAVTPAHVDHEHNLYFQIRGTKHFTTGGFPDVAAEQRTFEGMYADEYGNTPFAPADPVVHVLSPGDGLYVPPRAVHLVENPDEVGISFSLVFHDTMLDRSAKVHAMNAHLRQLRLNPRPPGESEWRDRMKAATVEGWRRGKQLLDKRRGRD